MIKQLSNEDLNKAIAFALQKHSGQVRKSTSIPYILHPLEVLQILYSMRADTNLMIAGVLHDTVEDTDTTLEEIRDIFGDDVTALVASNSEDKTKTWDERKQHTIDELAGADIRVKMLVLADKLSNIRSIAYDYKKIGDELWERFNAPREKQAWYYSGIQDSVYDMQSNQDCSSAYWEFVGLFKDVFVKYYLDETEQCIYQKSDDGVTFCLKRGDPYWHEVIVSIPDTTIGSDVPVFFRLDDISLYAVSVSRYDAELMEDMWNKPVFDCLGNDIEDSIYDIFDSETRQIGIEIKNSFMSVCCYDNVCMCKNINGKNEYKVNYTLDYENTEKLLLKLRVKYGLDIALTDIFKNEFGFDNGAELFEKFCEINDIEYEISTC